MGAFVRKRVKQRVTKCNCLRAFGSPLSCTSVWCEWRRCVFYIAQIQIGEFSKESVDSTLIEHVEVLSLFALNFWGNCTQKWIAVEDHPNVWRSGFISTDVVAGRHEQPLTTTSILMLNLNTLDMYSLIIPTVWRDTFLALTSSTLMPSLTSSVHRPKLSLTISGYPLYYIASPAYF